MIPQGGGDQLGNPPPLQRLRNQRSDLKAVFIGRRRLELSKGRGSGFGYESHYVFGPVGEISPVHKRINSAWRVKLLDIRTIEGARLAEAFDALRCAVVLINEHGTIVHTNRAAEHMLDKGGPIQSAQGVLQATTPSAASELRSAIALAGGNEAGIGKTGLAIRLSEPDVPPISRPAAHRERFSHAAATRRRCRRVHRCAT